MATKWSKTWTLQVRRAKNRQGYSSLMTKTHNFGRACILLSCTLIGWVCNPRFWFVTLFDVALWFFAPFVSFSWSLLHLLSLLLWCFSPSLPPSSSSSSSSSSPLILSYSSPLFSVKSSLHFSPSQPPLSIPLALFLRWRVCGCHGGKTSASCLLENSLQL